MIQPYVLVICGNADAEELEWIGFTRERSGAVTKAVRLRHDKPNVPLVATLLSLVARGFVFWARVMPSTDYAGMLLAGDGEQFAAAPAIGDCREPVILVQQDSGWSGTADGKLYWQVCANLIARFGLEGKLEADLIRPKIVS